MTESKWRTRVEVVGDPDAAERPAPVERTADDPFVIVVLGDFRGAGHAVESPAPIAIDRDNFDAVMRRLDPVWEGRLGGPGGAVQSARIFLDEIDAFHPDRLAHTLAPLRALLDLRAAIDDPARFESAAARLAALRPTSAPSPAPAGGDRPRASPSDVVHPADVEPAALLQQILAQSSPTPPAGERPAGVDTDLQAFVDEIVRPHLVQIDRPRQQECRAAVDASLTAQMRQLLHDPSFQALEAAWRGVRWLVQRTDTGPGLQIVLLPLSFADLRDDLSRQPSLEDSMLGRRLLDPASVPGGVRPSLLVGLYAFSHADDDLAALRQLGQVGQRLDAPFVAAAAPQLLGLESFPALDAGALGAWFQRPEMAGWHELRRSGVAPWIALALPRFLCRLPYGANTEPAETFAFEEHDGGPTSLLWANPALLVAATAAGVFTAQRWRIQLTGTYEVEGLPLLIVREGGAASATPCAEAYLADRAIEALGDAGLLPLVSARNADVVALPCMQSLAGTPLSWTGD